MSDGSAESSTFNTFNPFFIASSDNPNSVLVSTPFNGVRFTSWKRSMTISLSAKNKIGFVDGLILPPLHDSPSYSAWHRANSMVISWLLNSLSKSIAESVLFFTTAHEIWKELHQRYEQASGALIYQLQQQLFSTSQGSDEFTTYFTKLTKIWDELRLVQNIPPCSCGTMVAINKFLDEQRLIQLLMGLDDSYKVIRGQLLMMKPLPTVTTAYSLILQEEHQRGISSSTSSIDSIAMNVSSDVSTSSKKSLICNHCKKSGHTKAQCYRLHGFPAHFKFTKFKDEVRNKPKDEVLTSVQHVTSSPSISHEQYTQLLQLLNNHTVNPSSQANLSITEGSMTPEGPFTAE